MSYFSDEMRIGCAESDAKRDEGLILPEDIIRFEDIAYGTDAMQKLDVYRPKNIEGKLPVIVSVHGGGWVYGDKELYKHYCVHLAQRGFVVVNFTYRLSPEYKFPCHLEDTVLVFYWMLEHTEVYGMDKENIFAVGDSAGGNILALFCCLCTNDTYAKNFPFQAPKTFIPKAVALNCAVLDMDLAKKGTSGTTMQLMKDVFTNEGTEEELHLINPIAHVNEKFPPCYIMTSSDDFLKEHPKTFCEKLEDVGVPYEFMLYADETQPLYHVFHLDMRNEVGIQCNEKECAYFYQMIKR